MRDLRLVGEKHAERLDRADKTLEQHSGYLATLDRLLERQEKAFEAKIEILSLTVKAQFREMREELRRLHNGR